MWQTRVFTGGLLSRWLSQTMKDQTQSNICGCGGIKHLFKMVWLRLVVSRCYQLGTCATSLISNTINSSVSCHTVKSIKLCKSAVLKFSSNAASTAGRLYTEKHEWILVNGNIGTVGISQYAQEALGDVVYAQLPEIGTTITKNDEVGALESVKAASELYSPVSGRVIEKNSEAEETPALINQSCYEKGWLFKVELAEPEELPELLNEEQYQEFLKTDHH